MFGRRGVKTQRSPERGVPGGGRIVAVWGPTGAPGRTTVAITLADELARLGCGSLLVDGDVYGGVIAAVLGLLDESPGLAAACRQLPAKCEARWRPALNQIRRLIGGPSDHGLEQHFHMAPHAHRRGW